MFVSWVVLRKEINAWSHILKKKCDLLNICGVSEQGSRAWVEDSECHRMIDVAEQGNRVVEEVNWETF